MAAKQECSQEEIDEATLLVSKMTENLSLSKEDSTVAMEDKSKGSKVEESKNTKPETPKDASKVEEPKVPAEEVPLSDDQRMREIMKKNISKFVKANKRDETVSSDDSDENIEKWFYK